MDWSFQLYSARKFPPWTSSQDPRQIGYNGRAFGGVYAGPCRFRKKLDANGLSMPSAHFSIDLLEKDFDGAAKIAKTLGVEHDDLPAHRRG